MAAEVYLPRTAWRRREWCAIRLIWAGGVCIIGWAFVERIALNARRSLQRSAPAPPLCGREACARKQ